MGFLQFCSDLDVGFDNVQHSMGIGMSEFLESA